ncbi:reverse transcriptase [Gossypium australe]|uniref:Reverse transcriptase n=1 Tax=Gossypium australe TaxID=47621 RepID=A0A5B6VM50_9ROSI|nr:reverse transcriptase [Gossypium australe]
MGLGFRDLHLFNMALLGKQVCMLIHFKGTLCYKFPIGDIFHPKNVDKPSYTWTSIATTAKTLANGFVWLVGDGTNIEIRNDN